MKVFKFLPPYKANGKTNFPEAKARTGVYLIKKNDKLIYIGYSESDLYKTLYRHFQTWNDTNQPERISYKTALLRHKFTVRVVFTTKKRAAALEKALILKHQPADNKQKYNQFIKEANSTDKNYISSVQQIYEFAPVLNEAPF